MLPLSIHSRRTDVGQPRAFMQTHQPVMLQACLDGLALRVGDIAIDATFGRGGHSAALLNAVGEQGFVHALDQDPEACGAAWKRFGARNNFRIHASNFSELQRIADEQGLSGRVNGLLLDLGVSSPQLDDAARGFSFSHDGPLDMRMNPSAGESAAQWLARAAEKEIADVLFAYGDERASRRIAKRIVESRAQSPLTRTAQLAALIASAVPGPRRKIHPATRSFQAIRIHINGEMDALQAALDASVAVLAPGGRLAVISFHSLEDRCVKRFMRDAGPPVNVPRAELAMMQPPRPQRWFKRAGRFFPGDAETASNPRARSAVLRVAERSDVEAGS